MIDKQQQGQMDIGKIQSWMEKNQSWLTEWLTNVVTLTELQASSSGSLFQCFRSILRSNPPGGLLVAIHELNYSLIMSIVFGKGYMGEAHPGAIGDSAHPEAGQSVWKIPPMISGFYEQHKRMPSKGDVCLITAWRWNQVVTLAPNTIGNNKPLTTVESILAVDFIPDPKIEVN